MKSQKKLLLGSALALVLLAGCGAQSAAPASSASGASSASAATQAAADTSAQKSGASSSAGTFAVTIAYDYTRADTAASNQMAAWVEDKDGKLVKNLGATRFTATGGFARRKESLPLWVTKAHPEQWKSSDVDAVAQATPQPGRQTITWDGTDETGAPVPDGTYTVWLEGTLYWTSDYRAHATVTVPAAKDAALDVAEEFTEDTAQNRDMITNVKMTVHGK